MFKEFSPDLDIYFYCTIICFVSVSAKLGICTVVSVNGTLVEAKMCTFTLEPTHFIFVPFTLKTVQVPNLALRIVETKRIIVCAPLNNN